MNKQEVTFKSFDELYDYIGQYVADFVRDNMFELNDHPMDYQDHYDYIIKLFKEHGEQAE